MKYCKILFVLVIFICFSHSGNCSEYNTNPLSSQGKYSTKLNLKDASSIANQANRNPSVYCPEGSELSDDPFMNSAINSMGAMLQGMTNGSYSATEQQKQQMDYARQQMEYGQ